MFDQINKYKASFGRLFEAKTLKVMLEIALLTILLSFLGPIKNMIYTEVVNKLSLGITVKLGIIMFASYIVVQVIEECVSYFQIYLNTVLQLKLGQSVSHEINNKLAKVKLNSLEMYEIFDYSVIHATGDNCLTVGVVSMGGMVYANFDCGI